MRTRTRFRRSSTLLRFGAAIALFASTIPLPFAQTGARHESLSEIEHFQAENRQKLAQYTWQEIAIIRFKGKPAGKSVSQVRAQPDGKQLKTQTEYWMPGATGGLIRQVIGKERKDDIENSAEALEALAAQYTEVNPHLLELAEHTGNAFLRPAGPGVLNLVIKSLVKTNDMVTFVVNQQTEQITAVNIVSYLDDPKDPVSITAHFAALPDGTNHVDNATMNEVNSKVIVSLKNTDYKRLP